MNLSFLDDIVAWAAGASWYMQVIVKVLTWLAAFFPEAAATIVQRVKDFFDLFDKKRENGEEVTRAEKLAATDTIVAEIQGEYHGSDPLISESWIRGFISYCVEVIGAMRYGEDIPRIEKAVLKGYMSTSEDVRNAAETHAGFKLFGV